MVPAMPAIRICIAVSLALCFAAGPAGAQFWGALGEESDGGHLTCKKRIYVIGIKHGVEFCDRHHIR